jgi:hypothetical protein
MTTAQNRRIAAVSVAATCNSLSDLCLATPPPPTVCKSANYRLKRRIPLPLSLPLSLPLFFPWSRPICLRAISDSDFCETKNRSSNPFVLSLNLANYSLKNIVCGINKEEKPENVIHNLMNLPKNACLCRKDDLFRHKNNHLFTLFPHRELCGTYYYYVLLDNYLTLILKKMDIKRSFLGRREFLVPEDLKHACEEYAKNLSTWKVPQRPLDKMTALTEKSDTITNIAV